MYIKLLKRHVTLNPYAEVLSDVYSWVHGGIESGIKRNEEFINKHKLIPKGSGNAVDLGVGYSQLVYWNRFLYKPDSIIPL